MKYHKWGILDYFSSVITITVSPKLHSKCRLRVALEIFHYPVFTVLCMINIMPHFDSLERTSYFILGN